MHIMKGESFMPRLARVKHQNFKLHVMVRSIKEIDLFRDNEDKEQYFLIMRKYQIKHGFKIYAYCLMNNHGHFIIDCNGADISKTMHAINLSYARYYNKKYNRYGHVFQDRFKSKVINTTRYLITLSAYIHNNPKDIAKYKNNVRDYPFSSLKQYLNKTNSHKILSRSLLSNLVGFQYKKQTEAYVSMVKESNELKTEEEIEFLNEKTEYVSHKKIIAKYKTPNDIIKYVAKALNQKPQHIYVKNNSTYSRMRALSCVFMANFCNLSQKEICEIIGNITQSGISYLTSKGLKILLDDQKLLNNFLG